MFISGSCVGCGAVTESPVGALLCHRCRFSIAATGGVHAPPGVQAALPFDGVGKDLVVALKFRHRRRAAAVLAEQIVRRIQLQAVDLVTWAPTSSRRTRRRGYDQAELIARSVARRIGRPCKRLLYRAHDGPQTGKSRIARLIGPSFRARRPRRGLRVLVIDDVVTTGATLQAAAKALRGAGIAEVQLVAATSADRRHGAGAVPRSLSRPPVGCGPAWESSIASSAPEKARS
jgi:predicted amidophosphoribosyltransferase